ncbi:MAG: glycosyltransferase family 2 protein [Candidatus Bathyarchaeota archaeon]|nr:glycosyltransferase family 2 protein [Candidatus Bathyarchaeota archaeon]
MYKDRRVAVVVPAYNEEVLIRPTLETIPDYIDVVYAVDDGSKDDTFNVIEEIASHDPRIKIIRHEENRGVGAAIVCGYKRCVEDDVDIAVVMAGDHQMDPQYIPRLLDPIVSGEVDYTKGNRLIGKDYREGMSRWRFLGNTILTFLTKLSSGYWKIMDPQNGYTAISRKVLETIELDDVYTYYGYCNDILVKLNVYGFRVRDVSIPARYGNEKSKIRYGSYILKVSGMLLRNFFWRLKFKYLILSFNPLVFFYLFGMILTPIGFILGVWSIYLWVYFGASLFIRATLSTLIFIIGLQFLFFAMLYDMQSQQ